jgi:hypothetical protein
MADLHVLFVYLCPRQFIFRKPNYESVPKSTESAALICARGCCQSGHVICVFVQTSRHGTGSEMSFSPGQVVQKHMGNCKTSRARVYELNVINNPLSASDRAVIGLLNFT